LVAALKGKVSLSIVGPIESEAYWDYCRSLIAGLPPAVTVSHLGELPHQEIAGVFSKHDLFLFPTRGENYGHVILEAMTGGCPVVLSDQTPWRNLTQAGVGWDLPLNDPQAFQAALQQCMDMEPEAFSELCSRAWRYGLERSLDSRAADLHSEMFRRVLGSA
jgi:glycosyltransferase involved in cell wall biosynthesis